MATVFCCVFDPLQQLGKQQCAQYTDAKLLSHLLRASSTGIQAAVALWRLRACFAVSAVCLPLLVCHCLCLPCHRVTLRTHQWLRQGVAAAEWLCCCVGVYTPHVALSKLTHAPEVLACKPEREGKCYSSSLVNQQVKCRFIYCC